MNPALGKICSTTFVLLALLVTPADAFIRGDANNDGAFNALVDGLFVLSYGFVPGSPVPPCLDAADADDDGSNNALVDGLYLLNFGFVPGSPPPPPPFPNDGQDPTPDAIPDGDCGGMVIVPGAVENILRGCFSGLAEGVYIAKDDGAWQALWDEHQPGGTPPFVDFSTDIVVAVVLDFFNGTHEVQITGLEDITTDIAVSYDQIDQIFPCAQLFIQSQPFHFVRWVDANAAGVPDTVFGIETVVSFCNSPLCRRPALFVPYSLASILLPSLKDPSPWATPASPS